MGCKALQSLAELHSGLRQHAAFITRSWAACCSLAVRSYGLSVRLAGDSAPAVGTRSGLGLEHGSFESQRHCASVLDGKTEGTPLSLRVGVHEKGGFRTIRSSIS